MIKYVQYKIKIILMLSHSLKKKNNRDSRASKLKINN